MNKFNFLLAFVFLLAISGFGQSRYAEKEVVMDNDTIFLKNETLKVSGIVYNEHGEIGSFKNGLREGIHKEWFRNGNIKDEISYSGGLKNGEFRYWDDKGQLLKQGHYQKNKLDGFIKEWYHNGNIKLEVNYKMGDMHGLRTEWYKSGHKWSEQIMENGFVVSGRHFYNDGSEITHGNFIKH